MTAITPEEILQEHDLKNTSCRKYVINRLLNSHTALSEDEIKETFPNLFDRVTLYRTLKTLEEKDIIHKIVLNDHSIKYALSNCQDDADILHSHFHCESCDDVMCLHGHTHVETELPQNFVQKKVYVVIEGLCANCT